ncbi:serine/threonine-protein kinase AtPK2/AtPK19-like [Punica granatum]|uniref:non-specific serine/threonine protein kinase n=1 Tax=Punica granatum TaxID=22663 RepID=A0A6P8EM89_PUNGR|nr:serine/threonine-protein kinase AtPK2/AtPK19-like [Punica granatum]
MVSSASQKKPLLSLLTHNLTKLTIPSTSSSSPPTHLLHQDFDSSDVFGPLTPHNPPNPSPSSSSTSSLLPKDPQVIHNRSHSFVGPSPRYPHSASLPFAKVEALTESDAEPEEEEEEDKKEEILNQAADNGDCEGVKKSSCSSGCGMVIGVGDFEILMVVGKGAFGKVFMVRKKEYSNGDGIYAMKVMRKDTIIKKNHVDYMRAERDILAKVVHPFIVPLRFSFQTKSKLYLILDFINGGHLFFHLYRQGIFSEDQARFYTAEIISAVSHLHKCGIAHRDLKPENILMDADGHVMLTDFGLAKEIDGSSRSNSMCGTTEYMAPEILLSKGHNKDADWWSVGILLYEMLNGQPPFTHTNRQKLQQRIINEKVKLPPRLTSEAHSLLKGLLQKEPSKRMGSGPSGGDEIKGHKWFRSINWKKLEAREMQPKFKPDVSGRDCIANFDRCWTTMPPDDSPAPTPTAGEHFQGFTYIAPNPWLSSGSVEE